MSLCGQTESVRSLRTTSPDYTRFQKHAATPSFERIRGAFSLGKLDLDAGLKTDWSIETSCVPRLTAADALHNLAYSLDEQYQILDFSFGIGIGHSQLRDLEPHRGILVVDSPA
jgi:hypothetical protein